MFCFLSPKHFLVVGQDYELIEKGNIPSNSPTFLKAYKKENLTFILASTLSAVYLLNSTILTHLISKIFVEHLTIPREALIVHGNDASTLTFYSDNSFKIFSAPVFTFYPYKELIHFRREFSTKQ